MLHDPWHDPWSLWYHLFWNRDESPLCVRSHSLSVHFSFMLGHTMSIRTWRHPCVSPFCIISFPVDSNLYEFTVPTRFCSDSEYNMTRGRDPGRWPDPSTIHDRVHRLHGTNGRREIPTPVVPSLPNPVCSSPSTLTLVQKTKVSRTDYWVWSNWGFFLFTVGAGQSSKENRILVLVSSA